MFSAIGVAIDWDAEEGLGHLRLSGAWDELVSGANWMNSAAYRYIWEKSYAPASTPSITVLARKVLITDGGPQVSEQRVLKQVVGVHQLNEWSESGFDHLPAVIPGS